MNQRRPKGAVDPCYRPLDDSPRVGHLISVGRHIPSHAPRSLNKMGAEKREREDIENSAAQPETKQVKAEVDALGADGSILAVNCCTVEPDPDTGAASFKCRHPGCDRR